MPLTTAASLVAFVCLTSVNAAAQTQRANVHDGKMIYRTGQQTDGTKVVATVIDDLQMSGQLVSCAKCHRRSGYGVDEPGKLSPAITQPALFQPRQLNRSWQFRALFQEPQTAVESAAPRNTTSRPAYTDETLAHAIRNGIDSSGRVLDHLMPRYALNDSTMANLIAYLRSLSRHDDPGIDENTIHFAVVTTPEVSDQSRRAMWSVMDAYVTDHNREVTRYRNHVGNSPNYKDDFLHAYRTWQLHDWRLEGEPYSFSGQLSAYYRTAPVFALIGGVSTQPWSPIQRFCDHRQIPCLFPNTSLPTINANGGSTLYFNRGLYDESDAVLDDLIEKRKRGDESTLIHQFAIADTPGEVALRYTSQKLKTHHFPVADHVINRQSTTNRTETISCSEPCLLWLSDADFRFLKSSIRKTHDAVYLSGTLLAKSSGGGPNTHWPRRILVTPYRDPLIHHPRAFRIRSWMRSRRIPITDQNLQFGTYFALTVIDHSLRHMVDRFSRDYLIERVEHETENALNPGIFPRLSLGPDQRYASKQTRIELPQELSQSTARSQ
ncbi:c-type cytochrome [Rubripirellula lacrimiformis]|nr:hypothetical protein [Rubripirellula lacrimiformis]